MDNEKTASQELEEWKNQIEKDLEEEMRQHVEKMNKVVREAEQRKDFLAVLPGKVTKFGTSGHIPFTKKYVGYDVRIIVLNKKEVADT